VLLEHTQFPNLSRKKEEKMNEKPLSVLRDAFRHTVICSLLLAAVAFCAPEALAQQPADGDKLNRTVLPIPEPQYPHSTVLDVRNATPPPRFEVKAPAGAPNVLIVLIDDMGFGQSNSFGGPITMPTVDRLANNGLRYNQFHTTALCSPTRAALLTGRNHHMNNTGSIMETATAFPGNTGRRQNLQVASAAQHPDQEFLVGDRV
jgi:hypothetical protein